MSFVTLALLVALAAATLIVLADSGLRLWFALGGIKAQRAAIQSAPINRLRGCKQSASRMTTWIVYARIGVTRSAPLRAAA